MEIGANLHDAGDRYVLTATVPEHEQAHVSVALKGDQIIVQGYRRNEEKLELRDGQTRSSNAYQSYSESFPLPWPVEGKLLTRHFEGDRLVVTVPKKNEFAFSKAKYSPDAERARVEMPHFPDNLPKTEKPKGPPAVVKKSPSSGTLS
jgi:HSP20 family molecular chaperone IbpA